MQFRVLGPLEVVAGDVPLALGGPQQRAVLALLVLRRGEVVPRVTLVETLWDGDAPPSAGNVLRTYASRLRGELAAHGGAQLVGRPPGYALEIEPEQVDAHRFERLVADARQAGDAGDIEATATTLTEALALWRGEALADLAAFAALRPAATRLELLRLAALGDRIDADLALGRHGPAVAELQALTVEHPFHERFWAALIVALYRSGRQTDALAAFHTVRSRLVDEAGLAPSPELLALEGQVLNHADELQWHPPPPGRAGRDEAVRGNRPRPRPRPSVPTRRPLPPRLTRFVGREAELTALAGLVADTRLLTLVGAPGCGKTRLAIELAAGVEPRFGGGVAFVDLTPVADPALVTTAVARGLGVREPADPSVDDVVAALARAGPVLVLLDNCEHVAPAAGALAGHLIAADPSARVLATSRSPLGAVGEQLWPVLPLGPAPAAELFLDRARRIGQGLGPAGSPTVARAVDAICARLDHLPLAIELVAAWTPVLSLGQIGDHLDRPSPLLTGASPSARSRHGTMADTVAWSCRLVPPAARELFERLSVFAGGFDLDAAEAVASPDTDVLPTLAALIDHSLVLADPSSDAPRRYRLLEPVRQCGEAALDARGDTDAVRRRHAEHYLALARRCDPFEMHGAEPAFTLARLEPEEANLLAAVGWARTRPPDLGLRLCEAAAPLWEFRGPLRDGRAWLQAMLAAGTSDDELRIAALARAGKLAWRQGDYEPAGVVLEEARSLARQTGRRAWAANVGSLLGLVALATGDIEAAERHCTESDPVPGAGAGAGAGGGTGGNGATRDVPWNLVVLGWANYAAGDGAGGDARMHAALDANRSADNPSLDAHALWGLSYGAFLAHDTTTQRAHVLDALHATTQAGGSFEESDWVALSALLAAREGRAHTAVRLVGATSKLRRRHGSQRPSLFTDRARALFGHVIEGVDDPQTVDRLLVEGSGLTRDDIVAAIVAAPSSD